MGKLQDCRYKYQEINRKRQRVNVDCNPNHLVSSLILVDNDFLVRQILSRLPVKSLTRFKCVSKRWKSMIEEDSRFINLHLTHSPSRPGLFIFLPKSDAQEEDQTRNYGSFMLADLSSDGEPAKIHTIRKIEPFSYRQFLGPIAGLACFVDHCAVRIYNVCTGEASPWIKSSVCISIEQQNDTVEFYEEPNCYFGFDPATRKHKALFMWCKDEFKDFPVCEVLTVGEDDTWRVLDDVPPYELTGNLDTYANGSIYWYLYHNSDNDGAKPTFGYPNKYSITESIMAFDIGSEKFRVIPIPKFAASNEYADVSFSEVDGCLAMLRQRGARVELWIFQDHNKRNGISSARKYNWVQLSITIPSYVLNRWFFFHPVAGKDQVILETYRERRYHRNHGYDRNVKLAEFYSYDRKGNKIRKFKINGISFIPDDLASNSTVCTTLVESLLHVR